MPNTRWSTRRVTAAQRRTPAAAGFINAVLRRFLRERDALVQAVSVTPLGAYNHPLWWIDRIKADWPRSGRACSPPPTNGRR
jgi:16S rRNA (cytosine967-C5)-methyltransferase